MEFCNRKVIYKQSGGSRMDTYALGGETLTLSLTLYNERPLPDLTLYSSAILDEGPFGIKKDMKPHN